MSKQRFPVIGLLMASFFGIILFQLLFPLGCWTGRYRSNAKQVDAKNTASQLVVAMKHYEKEYGSLPTGDNAQIIRALRGDNPLQIVFFEARADRYDATGQLLDPWKTPFRLGSDDRRKPWAYSFGSNRIDEGGAGATDDIAS